MSDTEVGDDLFGDEDGDGDDLGSGEDGEEDEFVEVGAKGPLAANVGRLRQKVWLAKVPAALWEQLSQDDQGGELVVARGPGGQTVLQLRVSQPDGRVDEYALADDGVPRAYIFAETENDVSFEGTVAAQYSAIPAGSAADAAARRVVRGEDTISVSIRGDDTSSGPAPDYVPAAREALARAEQRKRDAQSAGRHERLPAEDVRSILFTLFAQRQHWSLRELIQETNQPPVFLKEILAEVAFFHERGPAHGLYELNEEFRGGLNRAED